MKYIDENGEFCVDIETSGLNQRGKDTIFCWATVILHSREENAWPVSQRVGDDY